MNFTGSKPPISGLFCFFSGVPGHLLLKYTSLCVLCPWRKTRALETPGHETQRGSTSLGVEFCFLWGAGPSAETQKLHCGPSSPAGPPPPMGLCFGFKYQCGPVTKPQRTSQSRGRSKKLGWGMSSAVEQPLIPFYFSFLCSEKQLRRLLVCVRHRGPRCPGTVLRKTLTWA